MVQSETPNGQMMLLFPRLLMVQSNPLLQTRRNDHIIAMKKMQVRVLYLFIYFLNKMTFNQQFICCEMVVIRRPQGIHSTYKYDTPFLSRKTAKSALSQPTAEQ